MESQITFKSYGEDTTIIFFEEYFIISIPHSQTEYKIFYNDVENFNFNNKFYGCYVTFFGKNFSITKKGKTKTTVCASFTVDKENEIDIIRMIEDRSPLRTRQTQFKEHSFEYEEKMKNHDNFFGNIFVRTSKVWDYYFIVDGVQRINFYTLNYVDGCRVLTLPTNTWNIKIGGGSKEDAWSTNSIEVNLSKESPDKLLELNYNLFYSPTLILKGDYDV